MGVGASKPAKRKAKKNTARGPRAGIRDVPDHVMHAMVLPRLSMRDRAAWTMAYKGSPAAANAGRQTLQDLDQIAFYGAKLLAVLPQDRSRWIHAHPPPRSVSMPSVASRNRKDKLVTTRFVATVEGNTLAIAPKPLSQHQPAVVTCTRTQGGKVLEVGDRPMNPGMYRLPMRNRMKTLKTRLAVHPSPSWQAEWTSVLRKAVDRAGTRMNTRVPTTARKNRWPPVRAP